MREAVVLREPQDNPEIFRRVEGVLNSVRQALRLHAGGIELVDIEEDRGIVKVRLTGTCDGCALSDITLKRGVETALCQAIPEVREVIAV